VTKLSRRRADRRTGFAATDCCIRAWRGHRAFERRSGHWPRVGLNSNSRCAAGLGLAFRDQVAIDVSQVAPAHHGFAPRVCVGPLPLH